MVTITITAVDGMLWALAILIMGVVGTAVFGMYAYCRMVWENRKNLNTEERIVKINLPDTAAPVDAVPPYPPMVGRDPLLNGTEHVKVHR